MSHASEEGHTSLAEPNTTKQVLQLTVRKPGSPHDLGRVPASLWALGSVRNIEGVYSCNKHLMRVYSVPGTIPGTEVS